MNNLESTFIEVTFDEPGDFLKIKETLTRVGIKSVTAKTLTQSCHILQKAGKYYIVHFKQMFMLDGKPADFTYSDFSRTKKIATMLQNWKLLRLVSPVEYEDDPIVHVIPHAERQNWTLTQKYTIGTK